MASAYSEVKIASSKFPLTIEANDEIGAVIHWRFNSLFQIQIRLSLEELRELRNKITLVLSAVE